MNQAIATFRPIGVTFETIDRLVRDQETDAVALYMAYCCVAEWQGTYQPHATDSFMRRRLGWGQTKLSKNKKELKNRGLVGVVKKTNDEGEVVGWYIQINHIVTENPRPLTSSTKTRSTKNQQLVDGTTSTLNETKVLSTKESITNVIEPKVHGNPEINAIVNGFKEIFGLDYPQDRRYAQHLRKKYGVDQTLILFQQAAIAQAADRYCPRTPSIKDFWYKRAALEDYFRDKNKGLTEITF